MNVISAENAGDKYGVPETMVSDGVGTIIGALFGTPFGTSVYIGHPAYKKMGAGISYSLINCVAFFFFAMFGLFSLVNGIVPKQAISPLIFFVGIMICQEALAAAPVRQYPAVIFGLFPAVLDWAVLGGLSFGRVGNDGYWGFVALSKADLLLALVSTSITCFLIDRNYLPAAGWCVAGALLSAFGILHQDVLSTESFAENSQLYCLASRNSAGTCDAGLVECVNFVAFPVDGAGCTPESTQQWKFMTAYLMVGAMCGLLFLGQKKGWVSATIVDDEDDEVETRKSMMRAAEKRFSHPDEDSKVSSVAP